MPCSDNDDKPYTLRNVPCDSLERIDEDNWNDAFRLEYVENLLSDDESMKSLSEEKKREIRKHLDVLCTHGSAKALKRKGYLCYGGSPVYECDWDESMRCFEKVLESGFDKDVANSLGYIYYYGRTSGGKSDYEKAYRYFSMAAFAGSHESLYKLGDMFLKGLGVPVSAELADDFYYRVYFEAKDFVLEGYSNTKFADAALRMASLYERKEYSEREIYGKYLEADYGLRLRAWACCYGDSVVRKSVDKGIEKYRNFERDDDWARDVISSLSCDLKLGQIFRIKLERRGSVVSGRLDIVSAETKRRNKKTYMMLTLPELSYCGIVRSFSFRCSVTEGGTELSDGEDIVFFTDRVKADGPQRIEFVTEDRTVTLTGSSWRILKPGKGDEFEPGWLDRKSTHKQ